MSGDTLAPEPTVAPPPVPELGLRPGRIFPDSLRLARPAVVSPFGRMTAARRRADAIAAVEAAAVQEALRARISSLWGQTASAAFLPVVPSAPGPARSGSASEPGTPANLPIDNPLRTATAALPDGADSASVEADRALAMGDTAQGPNRFEDLFGNYADLGLQLQARLESKLERNKNERCASYETLNPIANCQGAFQPQFDFQFNVRTGGVVADRVHVNVDYDSQREFDASNNISVYYEGKSDELLQRVEVGNVTFQPPSSRFITGGIPSGNYGIQAKGQLGPMRFQTIVAQQKGNVIKDRVFTVGDRTLQSTDADIEDYRIETRRFFFTVDPRRLAGYPNIDLLNQQQMQAAVASIPAEERPTLVRLYRLRFDQPPVNPNGPKFEVRGAKRGSRGPVYELLQPGVDYYMDPSLLWFSLVRPLSLNNERLVVAYNVSVGVEEAGVNVAVGGTPDVDFRENQFANLVWDPDVTPADSAFYKEVRSVYRLGGDDIQRQSVTLKIVTGNGTDQEKPADGSFQTYLQMFQMAQSGNGSVFDVDNRLWPRPGDPNTQAGSGAKLIKDYFLIFPSLRPFARRDNGLVSAGSPANDTIYTTLPQDLYSTQHPPTLYHIRARYQAEGGGDAGTLSLGSVQVRPNSERLTIDGIPLKRETDYTVDYELGMVSFLRADTLFRAARRVLVQYEENPLFAAAPTSVFGLASSFPLANGGLDFTVISQSQKTTLNRPPLGFEPASSLLAGVSGRFFFDANALTTALERLPNVGSTTPSSVALNGEFATSRPQPNAAGQAYVESFEGEGGVTLPLADPAWYYSSAPVLGTALSPSLQSAISDVNRAATMAWQNVGSDNLGNAAVRTIQQIDPQVTFAGGGTQSFEPILWMTLYPLSAGGLISDDTTLRPQWTVSDYPRGGRRWRSLRAALGPSGVDLSRVETLEFWSLVRVDEGRVTNPTLIFDFGDVSENTLAFAPETVTVAGDDSTFAGRRRQGFDVLNTERDQLTRGFNVATDDRGLPGDRVDSLWVVRDGGFPELAEDVPICTGISRGLEILGDTRANCTVRNNRLDEEDLDFDNVLLLPGEQGKEGENVRRYVVNMSLPDAYSRLGGEEDVGGVKYRWAHFRIPFRAPTDSIGNPRTRALRSLRVTVVSGEGAAEDAYTRVPLVRLRLVGSPWVRRTNRAIAGAAGESDQAASPTSYVIASIIGTQDRDTSRHLDYEPPPGVADAPENVQTNVVGNQRVQINERSLRLIAGDLRRNERAEAYFRFPEGQRNFMGYKELRVWARGRGNGWGRDGELQFFIKVGRDPNNFYMYRTPVNAGRTRADWLPEVRVDFDKLFALRAQVQNAFLQGTPANSCVGADSALIANSALPAGRNPQDVYAACETGADGGTYMVYTIDPNVSPPNLAAVQELAVGMVRVDSGTGPSPILGVPTDTLELWIDDIRLTDVVDTPGYAGQLSLAVNAGDIADLRVNVSRIDPNFRQLAEQPRFITDRAFDIGTSVRLDRLLPRGFGFALPLSVSHTNAGSDPFFLSKSDIRGAGVQGLRTPQTSATSYSLSLRRTTPLRVPVLSHIVNNLGVNTAYATSNSRSEYQEGSGRTFSLGLDFNLAARPREAKFPGWADRVVMRLPDWMTRSEAVKALRGSAFRWNPAQLRLTSRVGRTSDRRLSFTKPAESVTDTGRVVRGLTSVWQNAGDLELRPFTALSARLGVSSLRDLRDYRDRLGDTSRTALNVAAVAARERDQFLGMDLGLERERTMNTTLTFAPTVAAWIRPRIDVGTNFSMLRDPNARSLLRTGEVAGQDTTGAFRLPRRLNNGQTFTAATTVDFGKAILIYAGDSSFLRYFAAAFQPVDVTYNRSLQSFFDGTPLTPGLGYQFALGGEDDFRRMGGRLASSAGLSTNFAVNSNFALPFGTSLANRYQRTTSRTWSRLQDTVQRPVDAEAVIFPSVSLRWTFQPPKLMRKVVTSVGANVSAEHTHQSTFAPSVVAGKPGEAGETEQQRYPVNGSVTWAFGGGFSTNATYAVQKREERRPGSSNFGSTRELTLDVAKPFTLPKEWKLDDRLNTRVSFQRSVTRNFVRNLSGSANDTRSLADNGRQSINVNADTRVSQQLTFSLVGSRIVNFDNQYNRRFTQLVLTAVLQLQFFAGELR